jgi:hypothetical protein
MNKPVPKLFANKIRGHFPELVSYDRPLNVQSGMDNLREPRFPQSASELGFRQP